MLEYKTSKEKNERENNRDELCITASKNADFSPHDNIELSSECKQRLANLRKWAEERDKGVRQVP